MSDCRYGVSPVNYPDPDPGAYKLINIHHLVIFLKMFLRVLISEVSKYNMCKFYQIASNSLQVIHIVHEHFDCPSYISVL